MSKELEVLSATGDEYTVVVDDSLKAKDPAFYHITIVSITPKDAASFKYTKIVGMDIEIDDREDEKLPAVRFGDKLGENYTEFTSAIGKAYLKNEGYK